MSSRWPVLAGAALALLLALAYVLWPLKQNSLLPPHFAVTPVSFAALPGWQAADASAALTAFRRSCGTLAQLPDEAPMAGAGYAGRVGDWRAVCAAVPPPAGAQAARAWFEHGFTPGQVSAHGDPAGLFTGYFEPELAASRRRAGPYQTPVYGVPSDLITADLGQFRAQWAHETLAGRLEGQHLVPYADRAEIDAHGLATAKILVWAADPVALFFLQIQGSGRARLPDGSVVRLAYAAKNGRPYTAIGRTLIKMGAIPKDQVSLQSIRAWLKAHPDQAGKVMQSDASFVFFREAPLADPALGAEGTEGVSLTPGASLAVDARIHPLGVPMFVAAAGIERLAIAQDTGGAIRGAVRGDLYWGFGPGAEVKAGTMKARGQLYVLLPKALAARQRAFVLP